MHIHIYIYVYICLDTVIHTDYSEALNQAPASRDGPGGTITLKSIKK